MPSANKIYTVRPGDTLSAIARVAKIDLATLQALNPQIGNTNLIRPGDQIVVPASTDRSQVLRDLTAETYPGGDPEWLKVAMREETTGVREVDGPRSNPRIVEYISTCTDVSGAQRQDDGTAWCAAFVNWCLRTCEIQGTNSAWALSWKKWGVEDTSPGPGTIVVWERFKGPAGQLRSVGGHVAFLIEDRGDQLYVLGGNQSNAVCRRSYPRDGFLSDTVSGGTRVRNKYELRGFRTK